jgi:hypothetical protein
MSPPTTDTYDELQLRVEDILRDARNMPPDRDNDFNVRDMTQVADAMASATTVMTGMLGAVPPSACWSAASAS